jgi:hypothetical protein
MIILFSVFLLFLLVVWGMKMKEGLTMPTASNLISQLGIYYGLSVKNKNTNTDNSINEDNAYQAILDLHLTDAKYNAVINNINLDKYSKINMINDLLITDVTSGGNSSTTIDQFTQILKTFNDTKLNDTEKVVEITNITSADPRFSFLQGITSVKTNKEKLDAIQQTVLSILNTP